MPEETTKETDGGAAAKEAGAAGKKSGGPGQQAKGFAPCVPKFEGKCADLKGHIYDCSDVRHSDLYTKTTKEIAEYVGRTYKYAGDLRLAVKILEMPVFATPTDPPETATKTETRLGSPKCRIWEKTIDEHV